MIELLTIIIVFVFFLSLIEERTEKYNPYIYTALCVILILCASLREVGFDKDSENYEEFFFKYDDKYVALAVEYSYLLLSQILSHISSDVHIIFFVYALAGITIKMYAFRKLSDFWFLPMIVFLGNYYMLQDMTQIRASVVTGILLLSIIPLSQGKRSKVFLMIFGCCLIHYSSLALLPMLFLNNKDLSVNKRWLWAMIVPFGYALSLAKINILTELPIPYISSKIELYQELSEQGVKGDEINVFNAVVLVKMFTYLYVLYFYETIRYYNKYLPILVKMMGFSTLSYLTLSFLPTLAIRVSELYGIVDILMYTSIFYTIKPGWFGKLVVCTIGLVMFCINIFYIEIFNA